MSGLSAAAAAAFAVLNASIDRNGLVAEPSGPVPGPTNALSMCQTRGCTSMNTVAEFDARLTLGAGRIRIVDVIGEAVAAEIAGGRRIGERAVARSP